MSHCNILETKVGNESLWNPGLCMRIRVQLSLNKKGYEKQKSN